MQIQSASSIEDVYYFDEERAEKACQFFPKFLVHTKGPLAGKPFYLEPWEADIVRQMFGWRRRDNGFRRYRTVFIFVPRKNGKSTLCAGIAALMLFADGEQGAEVYSAAANRDQAGIVFNAAAQMIGASAALSGKCDILKDVIIVPEIWGKYEALSSDASTKHGLNPSAVIGDEVHAWKKRDLYDVLHTGTGAREQPLEIYITTAGWDKHSICYELYDYARKVRDGITIDPTFLPAIFEALPDDDWKDPEVWKKANPNLGVSVSMQFLENECETAKAVPARQNTFRQLYLNQWTAQAKRWIDMDMWDWGNEEFEEGSLRGRECWGGLDLARVRDLSALALIFPPVSRGEKYKVVTRFWCPEDDIRLRSERDRVNYDLWNKQGLLTATPGSATDFKFIEKEIIRLGGQFQIREIAFDRMFAGDIIYNLMDEGLEMIDFGQGFASMAAPTEELERLVIQNSLQHGGHPILRFCADNVVPKMDEAGNLKPDKKRSSERIDGVVALIMAIGRLIATNENEGRSIYEKREMVVL